MNPTEFEAFAGMVYSLLREALDEARDVDLSKFPRVRLVVEFEAPDKVALEIRKRRPWK